MLAHDQPTRDTIAEIIRGAVDDVVTTHISRITQEPAITAKIADRMESALRELSIFGYFVSVIATDIPDRGPGSLEKQTGVDLFVAIRVTSEDGSFSVAKGLLIQGKISVGHRGVKDRKGLREQCEKMVSKSAKGAYVWIYGALGVRSVPASEVLRYPKYWVEDLGSRNIAEHFRDVLDCVAGDEGLAIDPIFESPVALNNWMKDLGAQHGIAIDVVDWSSAADYEK